MNMYKINSMGIICKDKKSKEVLKIRDINEYIEIFFFFVKIGVINWRSNYC